MTLTEFLEARITEDEAAATDEAATWWGSHPTRSLDRVLVECEAKLRIVALHHRRTTTGWDVHECDGCGYDGDGDQPRTPAGKECPTLEALALPYADHPDYLPEWGV